MTLVLGLVAAGWPAHGALPEEAAGPQARASIAPLLERVTPAVVNIAVESRSAMEQNPLLRDPFFRFFFEGLPTPRQGRRRVSAGSGVIVDADNGYVLTNHHVIENASRITVTLKDRRQLDAELIGSDPATDIAVLAIDADELTALPLGNSDALKVGDFVIAVGNPFGLGQTVTSGIVSALGRSGLKVHGFEDFIQTDAPINPGNSGGALITWDGELVGINTAIIAPAGGNVGIGFAVPSRMANAVMQQLLRHGEIRRGQLGVALQDLTPDIAEALDLDQTSGAVISRVVPGSAAEQSGLRAGDVILAFNGRPVRGSTDLRNKVGLTRAGEDVELTVFRDNREATITVQINEPDTGADSGVRQLAGATLRTLRPGSRRYGQAAGVLVTDVIRGSRAWRHGLRPDDIIVAVNRRAVSNVEQLTAAIERTGGRLALNILRGNTMVFLLIR